MDPETQDSDVVPLRTRQLPKSAAPAKSVPAMRSKGRPAGNLALAAAPGIDEAQFAKY